MTEVVSLYDIVFGAAGSNSSASYGLDVIVLVHTCTGGFEKSVQKEPRYVVPVLIIKG